MYVQVFPIYIWILKITKHFTYRRIVWTYFKATYRDTRTTVSLQPQVIQGSAGKHSEHSHRKMTWIFPSTENTIFSQTIFFSVDISLNKWLKYTWAWKVYFTETFWLRFWGFVNTRVGFFWAWHRTEFAVMKSLFKVVLQWRKPSPSDLMFLIHFTL